eukprot:GHVH01007601.1.p1 GENE.GHVH01007601.1~~GHVH01007601.1.p1  ORF type:complete len:338 (+),score=26.08 GHVH01007601.1:1017-2030(+)
MITSNPRHKDTRPMPIINHWDSSYSITDKQDVSLQRVYNEGSFGLGNDSTFFRPSLIPFFNGPLFLPPDHAAETILGGKFHPINVYPSIASHVSSPYCEGLINSQNNATPVMDRSSFSSGLLHFQPHLSQGPQVIPESQTIHDQQQVVGHSRPTTTASTNSDDTNASSTTNATTRSLSDSDGSPQQTTIPNQPTCLNSTVPHQNSSLHPFLLEKHGIVIASFTSDRTLCSLKGEKEIDDILSRIPPIPETITSDAELRIFSELVASAVCGTRSWTLSRSSYKSRHKQSIYLRCNSHLRCDYRVIVTFTRTTIEVRHAGRGHSREVHVHNKGVCMPSS